MFLCFFSAEKSFVLSKETNNEHRAMMMDLAQLHVSREDMMASILEYIHEPMEIVAPLVIVGEKGSGKSALISAVGKMYETDCLLLFFLRYCY